MERLTLLVVDDDLVFLRAAADALESDGYAVFTAATAEDGLRRIREKMPDLLLLDLAMPRIQGIEVCRRLKKDPKTAGIPIIILTGSVKKGQEISCLDTGADDYMTKPVDWDRLFARCRALLRRSGSVKTPRPAIKHGSLVLDYANKIVKLGATEHPELTPKEFELLYELAANSPNPFSKTALYRRVWEIDPPSEGSLKTVDVHIRRIRMKLSWAPGEWLEHITGRGYLFRAPH